MKATRIKINSHKDFEEAIVTHNIPDDVLHNINRGISDWLASGGSMDDEYVCQQYQYLEGYVDLQNLRK